jgi:hypothetical protein
VGAPVAIGPEPGTKVVKEITHTRTVDRRVFTVEETVWNDTTLRSFHVYDSDGRCLTCMDAYDEFPSDEEILATADNPDPGA